MFYEPIYLKIFQCIFIDINNKYYEGYIEVFKYTSIIILN